MSWDSWRVATPDGVFEWGATAPNPLIWSKVLQVFAENETEVWATPLGPHYIIDPYEPRPVLVALLIAYPGAVTVPPALLNEVLPPIPRGAVS